MTAIVVLVVALVAAPVLPALSGTAGAGPRALPHTAGAAVLPAALLAPWSSRTGYDAAYSAEVVDPSPTVGELRVALTLWPTDRLMFLPPAPGAPPLSAGAANLRFGVSMADYAALEQYFIGHGLRVDHTSPDRLGLTLLGSATDVGAAFGTAIESGNWEGRLVHFPTTVPSLPPSLESEVAAVTGLSDGFSQFHFSLSPAPLPPVPSQGRTSTFITPSAAHLLYGLSALYNLSGSPKFATGEGIAIVLWGDGYDPSDLQTFFSSYYPAGFPQPSLAYVNVDGAPAPSASAPSDPSAAPQELTLDLEWAGSAAPGAALTAVYAPDGPASNMYSPTDVSLEDALRTAVNLPGVSVVSMSFGTPDGGDAALQAAFATILARASQLGITVLAASGDTGGAAKSGCQGGVSPDFPATSPEVLAVGGTAPVESLDAFGDVVGLDSEPAWNGSGGGFSVSYSAPAWQTQNAPPVAQNGQRGIPDVAGPAFDNFFYFKGGQQAGRGTSFATPMWAGLVAEIDALLGHPVGTVAPRLYSIASAIAQGKAAAGLVDITGGSNCIASAAAGWDPVTGWGTPRAVPLYADLTSSFVTVGLSASSTSVVPGGSFSALAAVTNVTTHRPIAGLSVAFTLTAPSYSGPCGGTLSSSTASTDASGSANATMTVPGCFLGGSALLTVIVASGGYFGSNSTTVGVNLVGLAGFLAFVQVFPYNVIAFLLIIVAAVGIGYWIGERRRPRRTGGARGPRGRGVPRSPYPVAPSVAPSLASAPGPSASPEPPPPPLPTPPEERPPGPSAPLTDGPPDPTDPEPLSSAAYSTEGPASIPGHVLDPPSAPAPLDELPRVQFRRCPTCLAAVGASDTVCPDCRRPLPPAAGPASGS